MDRQQFWRLINETRATAGDQDAHAFALVERLASLTPEEIVSFELHFLSLMIELDRAHVAAVAGMVLTLLSDDGFEEFCAWAILQGTEVVEDLLHAPDKVGRHFPRGVEPWCEVALVAATRAYKEKTGQWEMPIDKRSLPETIEEPPLSDDEVRERFPDLWRRFITEEGE